MKNYRRLTKMALAVLLASALLSAGCGAAAESSAPAEEPAEEEAAEPEGEAGTVDQILEEVEAEAETEPLRAVGLDEESADQLVMVLTNGTGQAIKEISVKSADEEAFPDNFLANDEPIADFETVELYFGGLVLFGGEIVDEEVDAAGEEVEEAGAEDAEEFGEEVSEEAMEAPAYDLRFVLEDDSEYILHAVPYAEMTDGTILVGEKVAYLEYFTADAEEPLSTEADEEAILKAAEEEAARIAAEEEAARKAAEEEARRQAEAEEAARQQAAAQAAAEEAARQAAAAQAAAPAPQPAPPADDCLGAGALIND